MTDNESKIQNMFDDFSLQGNDFEHDIDIRRAAFNFAMLIEDVCMDGRRKALALTKLEECVLWALKSLTNDS